MQSRVSCYCYADEGTFGGGAQLMSRETAAAAVDLLCAAVAPAGARLNLAFLGGEPLTNRSVLRAATERAAEQRAAARGLRRHVFRDDERHAARQFGCHASSSSAMALRSPSASLMGCESAHNLLRPFKHRHGQLRCDPRQGDAACLPQTAHGEVSARVTVTPSNLDLAQQSPREFVDRGFHSVGFSPVLSSPSGAGEMSAGICRGCSRK